MAEKFQLKALIWAVDRLSPTLKAINRASYVTRKSLRDIGNAGDTLSLKLGLPLSLLGGASIGALISAVKGYATLGSAINDASEKIGIGAEQLQEYQVAADLSGVSTESLGNSLVKLNKNLAEAASGKNADLAGLFSRLKIPLRDANRGIRDAASVLPDLADAMQKNTNPAVRTRIAMAAFGKAGADLIPMLKDGGSNLREIAEEARFLGLIMSDSAIKQADLLGDRWRMLTLAGRGLQNTIGVKLAPTLIPLINNMIKWVGSNRQLIAQKVDGVVQKLVAALRSYDWDGLWQRLQAIGSVVQRMVDSIGGWSNAFIAFAFVANATIISSLINIALAVYRLLPLVRGVAFAFLALNPVALAIGAIAIGALWMASNWAAVGPVVTSSLGAVISAVQELWGAMKELWEVIAPVVVPIMKIIASVLGGVLLGSVITLTLALRGLLAVFKGIVGLYSGDLVNTISKLLYPSIPVGGAPGSGGTSPNLAAGGQQRVAGKITVDFKNAPPGMRVSEGKTNSPGLELNPDVGYNSYATGVP